MVSTGGVSVVATELQGSSGKEIFVRTKLNFAQPETMKDFPQKIGQWYSTSYDWSALKEHLGAEIRTSPTPCFSSLSRVQIGPHSIRLSFATPHWVMK
jgi:hypothetical protein